MLHCDASDDMMPEIFFLISNPDGVTNSQIDAVGMMIVATAENIIADGQTSVQQVMGR
jgi:hypothetical protein